MTDICDRLNPASVMAHPLILQEAREAILRLRDENHRVVSWNQMLQGMVQADAIAERVDGR
jgi:hypothetical protein